MHSMQHLLELSQHMQHSIGTSARLATVELANIEELLLKMAVYKAVLGLSELDEQTLPDETECRLGQWYFSGEGKSSFAGQATYRELAPPHRDVHEHARRALQRYRSDDLDGALRALADMESANLTVMAGLRRLLGESRQA
ncbi:CZB domain-containing protein [Vogesella sp. LIG4]|uniref:CZB domain-containing protein n=1 Tax=Vogesella sp. LIG4 TaxID=1192162 RepID=UPI003510C8BA